MGYRPSDFMELCVFNKKHSYFGTVFFNHSSMAGGMGDTQA